MIYLRVQVRCDEPGCGTVTESFCAPQPQERLEAMARGGGAVFPWKPPEPVPGWQMPGAGAEFDTKCLCPVHAGSEGGRA